MKHLQPTGLILAAIVCASAFWAPPVPCQKNTQEELLLQRAIQKETVDGDLAAAITLYKEIIANPRGSRAVAARALLHLGQCNEKLGSAEARKAYERLVREYGDQTEVVAEARARLAALAGTAAAASGSTLAVRQVWAGPEVDLEGGISPDGRYISFIDWSTGDLAVHDLATRENRRLTKNSAPFLREYADFATFSPDGQQLAYGWCKENGTYDLRVIGIEGSGQRILHRSEEFDYFLPYAWSRDGKHILASVGQNKGLAIALVSTGNGSVRVLKRVDWLLPQEMSLSPDGRWIAYDFPHGEAAGQYDIHLLAADGTRDVPVVEHPSNDLWPVWTPDGKRIVFVSDRGGTLGFWMVPVLDGQAQGPPQLVKPDVGRIRPFGIGNNGVLYYGLIAGTGDVYEVAIEPKSGKLGSAPSLALKHYVGFNGTPDYSPDGQFLACISVRGSTVSLIPGSRSLVVRSLKTGEEREFPLSFAPGWELKWAPDSRFVLVPGRDTKGRISTYQVDARTGEQTSLGEGGVMTNQHGSQRGWFPDQKSIYLVMRGPQDPQGTPRWRLVRQDLTSRKIDDLFAFRSDKTELRSVTLAPDGKQFACWLRNLDASSVSLVLIPATGGEPHELLSMKDDAAGELNPALRGLSWTPDGGHLVYARRSAQNKEMDLWRVAVAGGEPENVGPLLDKVFDVVVHPSGDRVAFSTREIKQEVWTMENFLPVAKPR